MSFRYYCFRYYCFRYYCFRYYCFRYYCFRYYFWLGVFRLTSGMRDANPWPKQAPILPQV